MKLRLPVFAMTTLRGMKGGGRGEEGHCKGRRGENLLRFAAGEHNN